MLTGQQSTIRQTLTLVEEQEEEESSHYGGL